MIPVTGVPRIDGILGACGEWATHHSLGRRAMTRIPDQGARPVGWILALGAACLLAASHWLAPRLDAAWIDGVSRGRAVAGAEAAGQVVLVGLDERSLKAFPDEPLALWHRHFGELLSALAQASPKAVGLDVNLPDHSFGRLDPGADLALLQGLVRLDAACPLVLGLTVTADGQPRPILPAAAQVVGDAGQALVQWKPDPDGVVRRFTERLHGAGSAPTLAGQVARRLGRPVGEGLLDYQGASRVPYVPFHQVVAWARQGDADALRRAFGGRVVLIGSVLPFEDRLPQAVDLNGWGEHNVRGMPGVLLHLQALRNLLGSGFIQPWPLWAAWGLAGLLGPLGWVLFARPGWGLVAVLAGTVGVFAASAALLRGQAFLPPTLPTAGLLLGWACRGAVHATAQLRERRRLRSVFGGYVSPTVLDEILSGQVHPGLEAQRAHLCVLFSDVRGYTTLSEGREPEAVIAVLNRYFDRMVPLIHRHGGVLDSYMGDGIMAHFGHPKPLDSPEGAAFQCAREMLDALEAFNRELEAEGHPALKIGIGLHAGPAVVGHIGCQERHEYTAIGDTVNVASRVEGLTKDAGFPLLVTGPVAEALGSGADLVPLGPRAIKGHTALAVWGWPGSTPT